MKKSEALFGLLRIPIDCLSVCAALLLAYRLREANVDLVPGIQLLEPATTLPPFVWYVQSFVYPSMLVVVLLAASLRLYTLRTTRSAWRELGRTSLVVLFWLMIIIAWFFLVKKQLFYSRILLLHATGFLLGFLWAARSAVLLFQRGLMRHGIGVYRVVSIGAQPVAAAALATLEGDKRYAYLGHVPDLAALHELLEQARPDLVIQTDPDTSAPETIAIINECRSQHLGYGYLPPALADVPHQLVVERLGLLPMMRFQPTPLDGWGRIAKRGFDCCIAGALIVVLSPLLVTIALLILLTSGRPIFYISRRVGDRGSKAIPLLKFRSMVRDADQQKAKLQEQNERGDGPLFKLKNDPRITPIGRLLRRFDLDELPQLFNVLLGQMSLVGPRPHLPEEVDQYQAHERRVFAVKPGMTGLAQISGRSTLSFADEVRLDMQYIEEWSVGLDLWILWRTVAVVISRQ